MSFDFVNVSGGLTGSAMTARLTGLRGVDASVHPTSAGADTSTPAITIT